MPFLSLAQPEIVTIWRTEVSIEGFSTAPFGSSREILNVFDTSRPFTPFMSTA